MTDQAFRPARSRGIGSSPWVLAAALGLLLTTSARAVPAHNVTAGELALLPPFCIDTEGFMYGPENSPRMSPRAPGWVKQMGHGFWALHHYCWARVHLNRLRTGRADTPNKKWFAQMIANEHMYVVRNVSPDFILLPEVWSRIGEALLLAGDVGGAMEAYANARSLKPDFWPAYTQWAAFLVERNKRKEALDLITEGLRHAPNSPQLRESFKTLGGVALPPPAPDALLKAEPVAAPAQEAAASAAPVAPVPAATAPAAAASSTP